MASRFNQLLEFLQRYDSRWYFVLALKQFEIKSP